VPPTGHSRGTDEALAARVAELEALCSDILLASAEANLPQALLNRLWTAVGHGESPQAFDVAIPAADVPFELPDVVLPPDLPPVAPRAHIPDSALSTPPSRPFSPGDAKSSVASPDLKPIGERKTVVVVDDDPMMLKVLGRILERENYELVMASSGPEALQKIEELGRTVHLLVTDYAMPGMQGRQLAERVRGRYPTIRVLYQTGFSDLLFEDCMELEEGAAFVEKPFTARGLREAARMVLFGTLNPS
jgi:CheY-like chemotaxis protein